MSGQQFRGHSHESHGSDPKDNHDRWSAADSNSAGEAFRGRQTRDGSDAGAAHGGRDDRWDGAGSGGANQRGGAGGRGGGGGDGSAGGRTGGNGWDGGGDQLPAPVPPHARPAVAARQSAPDIYYRDPFGSEGGLQDDVLDLRKYLGIIIKHRWLIAGIAAVTVFLGLFYTLLQTPIYRGSATIEIKRQAANLSGIAGLEAMEAGQSAEFYQTQYELLKSRSLAERVVSKLSLAENARFIEGSPSLLANASGLFMGTGRADAPDIEQRQRSATRLVMDGLSVEPVRSSSVVRVNFDHPEPAIAENVTNAVVEGFIESNLERNYEASAHARNFLEERLQELRLRLEESEKALVAYAESQDILTTGEATSLASTDLAEANSALAEARQERTRNQMLWQQANSGDRSGLPQGFANDTIEKLRGQRAALSVSYQEKLNLFKPDYPDMVHLRAQIAEMDRQIQSEIDSIRESLRLRYQASMEEEEELTARVAELKSAVMDYQNRNIQYTILQREVDTNRSLYDGLLQRYKEIGVAGNGRDAANNVSIVDRAQRPGSPFSPSLTLNLALSLMLGVMFGGSAAFVREFFDDTFKTPEELEEVLGLPLLGVIPKLAEGEDLKDSINDMHSAVGEAYRSLRTALQFSTAAGTPKSIHVTSTRPSEGKSTAALNLAQNFAKLGLKVLLIDADLRKPSLHRLLGCRSDAGLSNCLVGNAIPPQVFQTTGAPNLTFLACGPLPPDPAELLAGPSMATLLTVASERFDLVVVDSPPVGGMADAPLLASMTAGTLLVVEANQTHRRAVVTALKRLHFARAEMLGVVLNKFDIEQAGYAYGYGYGYGGDSYYSYGADAPEKLGNAPEKLTDARDA